MPQPAPNPIPDGMHTVTPSLWFNGNCKEAVDFYQKAFCAELPSPLVPSPDGKTVMHAMVRIGDSSVMMADAFPGSWEAGPQGTATAGLWLYVEDCDGVYKRAVDAGCEVLMPMEDAFWGDRFGKVKDPFGHCWSIASHRWIFTPEEMEERRKQQMGG